MTLTNEYIVKGTNMSMCLNPEYRINITKHDNYDYLTASIQSETMNLITGLNGLKSYLDKFDGFMIDRTEIQINGKPLNEKERNEFILNLVD